MEQIAILVLTLVFGLVGLAVHVLWLVAIVLMAVLLGLMASELRSRRDGGVISQVASAVRAEAKHVAEDTSSVETDNGNEPEADPRAQPIAT